MGKTLYNMERIQEIVARKGGICLNETYEKSPMDWRCGFGHTWKTKFRHIVSGSWCPICYNLSRMLSPEIMHVVAKERGGKCLSTTYVGIDDKLEWECQFGHRWFATLEKIKNGKQWCPSCRRTNRGEYFTRLVMERRFGDVFPKAKPSWLIRDHTTHRMELDGYSPTLKLAFEYHGEQHYRSVRNFGHSLDFEDQQRRDNEKRQRCIENDVTLLEIPFFKTRNWHKEITETLNRLGYPTTVDMILDVSESYLNETYEKFVNVLAERKGRLMSKYISASHTVSLECHKGHGWIQKPSAIISGKWCLKCSGKAKLTLEKCQEMASSKGGQCRATSYTNAREKIEWECSLGHRWMTKTNAIQQGHWCPVCSHDRRSKKPLMTLSAEAVLPDL